MRFRHCPRCGGKLRWTRREGEPVPVCSDCDFIFWQNSKPTACAIIRDRKGLVLLGTRGRPPFQGWLDIPGGFLRHGEDPIEGLRREIREEVGVEIAIERFLGVVMDRYEPTAGHTLNFAFAARIRSGTPRAGDDLTEVHWVDPRRVDRRRLSFKGNARMLDSYLEWRRRPRARWGEGR